MSGFPFLKNFRGLRLSRKEGELEFQDIFFDKFIGEREAEIDAYSMERKLEMPLSHWLLRGLYGFFIIGMVLFFGKTFQLQAFAGDELQDQA